MTDSIKSLNLPDVKPVQYERNFIDIVVCELKFPIILDWENKPPASIQKELRKDYPHHNKIQLIDPLTQPGESEKRLSLQLHSKNRRWTVAIKSDSILLQTKSYLNFEEFSGKLQKVINVVKDKIDSDFFTRVGLRYINVINFTPDEFEELINRNLVAPILDNVYGTVSESYQRVTGITEHGLFNFRHGIYPNDTSDQNYLLDFDYFKEGVEIKDTLELVKKFHEYNFKFFHWTLGKTALEKLGKATLKPKK